MIKIITPPKDKRKPYTQRQLLEAIKAILCNGSCVIVPNTSAQKQKQI